MLNLGKSMIFRWMMLKRFGRQNITRYGQKKSKRRKTAEDIAAHFNALSIAQEEASAAADDYTDKVSSLADVLSNLSTISGNIEKLSKTLGSFAENGVADIDALSGLSEVFGDLSSFEDFVNVMNDSASTMEDVQDACNRLAAEYIDASHILDDLDDSTASLSASASCSTTLMYVSLVASPISFPGFRLRPFLMLFRTQFRQNRCFSLPSMASHVLMISRACIMYLLAFIFSVSFILVLIKGGGRGIL